MTQKTNQNPWTMDVRVRERNLKSGSLTDKDLEKYLTNLTDVGDQAESFSTAQPALAQPHPVHVSAPAPIAHAPVHTSFQPTLAQPIESDDALSDEEEDEDEDDDDDVVDEPEGDVSPAAPEPADIPPSTDEGPSS
jgi:hypothetical protein